MKILNLGRAFALVALFTLGLFSADIKFKLKTPAIYAGDNAIFIIEAVGDNIQFEDIQQIENYPILDVSSATRVEFYNTKMQSIRIMSYLFKPTKDVTIPPITIKIDGKEYKTKPAKIKVLQQKISNSGADNFKIELKLDKDSAYVGESVGFKVLIKTKVGFKPDRVQISPPAFKNFWVKDKKEPRIYVEGNYEVQEYQYLIFPQKDGNLTINPITAQVGKLVEVRLNRGGMFNDKFYDDFFKMTGRKLKWIKIASNSLSLNVKPLPNGVKLYGEFDIEARPDKFKTKANEAVNLKIKIVGNGNFEDIDKFTLNITDAVVYADEPKIRTSIKEKVSQGEFVQNIAIIPSHNFTIPPIEIKYFDSKLQKVVTKRTKPVNIIVEPNPLATNTKTTTPTMQMAQPIDDNNSKDTNNSSSSSWIKYILLLTGLIIGFVAGYLFPKNIKRESKKIDVSIPVEKAVKRAKTNSELFNLLLPYAKKDQKLDEIIEQLEDSIYNKKEYQPNKQDILWALDDINEDRG